MKNAGSALMIVAVLIMGGALLYDTTVETGSGGTYGAPDRVHNIGAMQYQELFFLAGIGSLIAGAILYGFGELAERMERAGTAKAPGASPPPVSLERGSQCDWCDRDLGEYTPCSQGSDQQNRERAHRIVDPACILQFKERGFLPDA